MPRRFAISNACAITALLFGILLMHGFSTAASHDAAHQHEGEQTVALISAVGEVSGHESDDSHAGHLWCLCTCVLMAGVAGGLLAAVLQLFVRRPGAVPVLPPAYRRNGRATTHPPPRRKLALLSVALH